ncbi:MAG: hypothetical protein ABIE74_06205 [Pseudomonadota bacterium]
MKIKFNTFDFLITNACDKRCSICCTNPHAMNEIQHLKFNDFCGVVDCIEKYLEEKNETGNWGISGGEPFMYSDHEVGKNYTLVDIVEYLSTKKFINSVSIRTSGFDINSKQKLIFDALEKLRARKFITFTTSYNLFQKGDINERLKWILPIWLESQDNLEIQVIYNKSNYQKTLDGLNQLLKTANLLVDKSQTIKILQERLHKSNYYSWSIDGKRVDIKTYPAYSHGKIDGEEFFEFKTAKCVSLSKADSNAVLVVNFDGTLHHCCNPYYSFKRRFFSPKIEGLLSGGIALEDIANLFSDGMERVLLEPKIKYNLQRDYCDMCSVLLFGPVITAEGKFCEKPN